MCSAASTLARPLPIPHGGAFKAVTKPYKSIGFGAMDVTKPYEFIGFGAMDVTKPYKFIGFGANADFAWRDLKAVRSELPQRLGSGPLLCLTLRGLPGGIPGAFFEHSLDLPGRFGARSVRRMLKECSQNSPGSSRRVT